MLSSHKFEVHKKIKNSYNNLTIVKASKTSCQVKLAGPFTKGPYYIFPEYAY